MTFLKSRSGSTRVIGCPDVVATAPDGYTLPMRVDPNTSPPGAIWIPKVVVAIGYGAATSGVTTGTTLVSSVTVPDQGVPGIVLVAGTCLVAGTVPNDQFTCFVDDSVAAFGYDRFSIPASPGQYSSHPQGPYTMPAGASKTFRVMYVRLSGTGSGTTFADPTVNFITATFTPS